jgi:hypothetical protein
VFVCFYLVRACCSGSVQICQWLLDNGADPADVTAQNNAGYCCMHWAAKSGNWRCCKWLLQHGADIHCKNIPGWTPLRIAVQHGHVEVCMWLISVGALEVEENSSSSSSSSSRNLSMEIFNSDIPDLKVVESSHTVVGGSQHYPNNSSPKQLKIKSPQPTIRDRLQHICTSYLMKHDLFIIGVVGGSCSSPLSKLAGSSAPAIIGFSLNPFFFLSFFPFLISPMHHHHHLFLFLFS